MIPYILMLALATSVSCSEKSSSLELIPAGTIAHDCRVYFNDIAFVDETPQLAIVDQSKLTIAHVLKRRSQNSFLPYEITEAAINSKEKKIAALIYSNNSHNRSLQMIDMHTLQRTDLHDLVRNDCHCWYNVEWHPAGNTVLAANASGSKDCPHLIDVRTGEKARVFENQGKDLGRCKLSPDGEYLAGATMWDKTIIIWHVASGKIEKIIPLSSNIALDVHWSPDQKWLLASQKKDSALIEVSDESIKKKVAEEYIYPRGAVFIDYSQFIFLEKNNLELFEINTNRKKTLWRGNDDEEIGSLALSKNGHKLAVTLYNNTRKNIDTIKLFDVHR